MPLVTWETMRAKAEKIRSTLVCDAATSLTRSWSPWFSRMGGSRKYRSDMGRNLGLQDGYACKEHPKDLNMSILGTDSRITGRTRESLTKSITHSSAFSLNRPNASAPTTIYLLLCEFRHFVLRNEFISI
uniref:AlNc14C82G5351 protein n=1 Tax=Albugo laibachii Nc14 TaxID=890382 RepID=F0WFG2_9STRA|nr:AlNc14C82G5351 [Albugo laibachii Nc14]|eukprot:CCA19944.1 AlNc14C82G5351 [Albugo laibachii Nc14]